MKKKKERKKLIDKSRPSLHNGKLFPDEKKRIKIKNFLQISLDKKKENKTKIVSCEQTNKNKEKTRLG